MSQAKVDRYKLEKANRKETMKKQKVKQKRNKVIAGIVCLGFLSWVGYSTYDLMYSLIPKEEIVVDYTAFDMYMEEIMSE